MYSVVEMETEKTLGVFDTEFEARCFADDLNTKTYITLI
jgi:hypothetical protein